MGAYRLHLSPEVLSAFADGETTGAELERAQRHLARCATCTERLAGLRWLDAELTSGGSFACAAARPLLSAHLDGELEPGLVPIARQHLAFCEDCRETVVAWKRARAALAATVRERPSERVDEFIASIARRSVPRLLRQARFSVAIRAAAAVAVLAAVLGGSALLPATPERAGIPGEPVMVAAAQTVVLNPRTNTLYVLRPEEGVVHVRDAATDAAIAELKLGGKPTALALNEATNSVFVLDSANKTITQIDGSKNTVVASAPVAVAGTPTSLQVDPEKGKLLVTTASKAASGQIAVVDPSSSKVEAVREVAVAPSLVVLDPSANRTFVLSPQATLVLDTTTYERVATLPGGAIGAVPAGNGVTAVLTAVGDKARVSFFGTAADGIELSGTPLAIASGPDGSFAVLLDLSGRVRLTLVAPSGLLRTRHLDGDVRQLAYDATARSFTLVGRSGDVVTTVPAFFASTSPEPSASPAAPASPAPSALPSSPTASPAASPSSSPSASATPRPTPRPTASPPSSPGLPAGARAVWSGTYFLELPKGWQPRHVVARGSSLWFIDESGAVVLVDTDTGSLGKVSQLPVGVLVSRVALGPSTLYVLDGEDAVLYLINLASGRVETLDMPFGRSVTALSVAPSGHVWFSTSSLSSLIDFDPKSRQFRIVNPGSKDGLSGVSADIAGRVWYAFSTSGGAAIGAYDVSTGRTAEYELPDSGPIDSVFADEAGAVYVATTRGVLLALRAGAVVPVANNGPTAQQQLARGEDGVAWLLHVGAVQARVGPASAARASLLPASVNGFAIDGQGRAWVADRAHGGFYIVANPGAQR